MYILIDCSFHHRSIQRYTGALHNLPGGENTVHRVRTFFEFNTFLLEDGAIFGCDFAGIAQKHVETFVLGQNGGAGAAFAGTEDYESFLFCVHRRMII